MKLKNISDEMKSFFSLASVQSTFFTSWAFVIYSGVYLQQLGYSAAVVGNINAINSTVTIFSMMFFGMLSDKINSVKKTLLITLICSAVFYSLIPLVPIGQDYTLILFFAYYPLVNAFKNVTPTLLDNFTVRTCANKGINFGIVRSLGSLCFALFCFVATWTVSQWGIEVSFPIYGGLALIAIICIIFAPDPIIKHNSIGKRQKLSLKPLLKNYYYVSFLIVMAIVQFAVNAEVNFYAYYMESIGVKSDSIASVFAVKALFEIPCLVFMARLRKKINLKYLLIIGFLMMGLECILLGFWAADLNSIIICAAFFGLGNGIFIGSNAMYIFKLAPDRLKASAQTIYAAVASIAGIAGNMVGGYMFDILGGKLFYTLVACIFVFGTVLFFVSLKVRKSLVNPADEV